jgi:hypothetical protein
VAVARDFRYSPEAGDVERARKLVSARAGGTWGFKEPRAALFIDLWERVLPDAKYLFLYRHPVEVVLSMLRRGDLNYQGLLEALDTWYAHNLRIAAFVEAHPERAVLAHVFGAIAGIDHLAGVLRTRLGFSVALGRELLERTHHPEEMAALAEAPALGRALAHVDPGCADLYRRLNALAELPPAPRPGARRIPDLEGVVAMAEALPHPLPPAQARAVLLLLVSLAEPEMVEQYFTEGRAAHIQRERGLRALSAQVAELQEAARSGRTAS